MGKRKKYNSTVIRKRKRIWLGMMIVITLLLSTECHGKDALDHITDVDSGSGNIAVEKFRYVSGISKKDCLLCGKGRGTLLPLYRGEENIGVISLNTFDLAYIGINRYDDNGKLIEEPANGTSMRVTSTGEDGFRFSVSEDTDRGYARCDLYFNKDETLDIEQAATHMCAACLERVVDDDWDDGLTGMAVINFSNSELRMLRENLLAFQMGDFYISCSTKRDEAEGNSLEMDLLVFYCPKRYGD